MKGTVVNHFLQIAENIMHALMYPLRNTKKYYHYYLRSFFICEQPEPDAHRIFMFKFKPKITTSTHTHFKVVFSSETCPRYVLSCIGNTLRRCEILVQIGDRGP
jgi:hypothetical protein